MNRPIYLLMLLAGLVLALGGCPKTTEDVVKKNFPACFEEPMIGASSGVRCEQVEATGEWRIYFWHGWGDCPAGCINKEITARYVVDRQGRIFEADKNFKPTREVAPGEVIPSQKKAPSGSLAPGASFLPESDQPQTKPDADPETAGHDTETVWIGRSTVIGQCMDPDMLSVGPGLVIEGAPEILKRSSSPGVAMGPRFKSFIEKWEKEQYDHDPERFMCRACQVCKTFAREYMQIYKKDLDKFTTGPEEWRRVDE